MDRRFPSARPGHDRRPIAADCLDIPRKKLRRLLHGRVLARADDDLAHRFLIDQEHSLFRRGGHPRATEWLRPQLVWRRRPSPAHHAEHSQQRGRKVDRSRLHVFAHLRPRRLPGHAQQRPAAPHTKRTTSSTACTFPRDANHSQRRSLSPDRYTAQPQTPRFAAKERPVPRVPGMLPIPMGQ